MKIAAKFLLTVLFLLVMSFQINSGLNAKNHEKSDTDKIVNVDIKLFTFKPAVIEIEPGKTVVWTNGDAIQHSITSGTPDDPSMDFDSGYFVENESYSHTFREPGEYPYYCKRHESMRGVVKVVP